MTRAVRLAIVGCGWAGDIHATGIAKLPDQFTITACCDPNPDRRESFAKRYGIGLQFGDYSEAIRSADVDVVVLCTPPQLHYQMAVDALALGKHVVCEKPLTSSLELTDRLIDAQARSGARLMPIFQYRFGPGLAKVRHVIQSGLAGKHYVTSVEVARTRAGDYYREAWRGKFATELGGVHVTQAIHIHDILLWLLGPAASVASYRATRVNPIEVEDCAVSSLRMADGSLVSIASTLGSVGQLTRIRMCFENVTFERNSDHDISKPADDPWEVSARTESIGAAIEASMAQVPEAHGWFAGQYELLHTALHDGSEFPVTLAEARASLELTTAMYYSDETGQAVELPIVAGHPRYSGWQPASNGRHP